MQSAGQVLTAPLQQEAPPNKVLGVWGLSSRSREEDVRDMFTKLIELEHVSLITDRRVSTTTTTHCSSPLAAY